MPATAPTAAAPAAARVLPYAATIFLSAFLLFLVQPIIAKQILPWFGGSAAVWTTCLVFFQSALLAGYAYADATHRLGLKRQTWLHIGLLVASLVTLPILASEAWKPAGSEDPIGRILLLLAATIGLPYFLLATTTPLLQSWYWRRFETAVPYRLFALSNFASLLALLGFPILFEPWLTLPQLGWTWSAVYALFVLACAATGWLSLRAAGAAQTLAPQAGAPATAAPPTAATQLLWLLLSAMGSAMLLATTNHVTQNIASVPFLWVVPLSLYLITFILCFDHPRWYVRPLFVALLLLAVPAMAWKIPSLGLKVAMPLYFAGLFVACMFCHGELARLKPDPAYLTRFYLMMSAGGAAGSVLVAIVAPQVLAGYFELNIALVALALLAAVRLRGIWLLAAAVSVVATGYFAWVGARDYGADVRTMERDFYGVVRTRDRTVDDVTYRAMLHGGIIHGGQLQGEQYKNVASDYFGPGSGYGRLFTVLNEIKPGPRKVGIVGLGAGVVAAYGRAGDEMVFYEISPKVVEIQARDFSFLNDTPAKTDVVLGDGRLSLEREAPRGYDVLGIDAFSGDSIPMHLVTREAMQLYLKHLAPDGVIVFQATNRYIDIMPVIQRHAQELGLHAMLVTDTPESRDGADYWLSSTDQILVTRDKALFEHPRLAEAVWPIADRPELPTFTDAHHNLARILK
ncbi:MAG: fused MFS/spermidine synthase [Burkholderiales bacterium]|jgi:SAM-dependent methyltransferase|nr:fused MFS/spermidine synthase [Burkholderiales bacterium]